jgi:glucose/arabinose dehydrogenase
MSRCRAVLAGLLVGLLLSGAAVASADNGLNLVPLAGPGATIPFSSVGGHGPVGILSPPGDTTNARVFVYTQDGYIYVYDHGVLQPTPFLDIHQLTDTCNENGLLSVAFPPDYATSGVFYVHYSDTSGSTPHTAWPCSPPTGSDLDAHKIVAYHRSASDPDVADATPDATILSVPTTGCPMTSPHYGGQISFGPDGYLWAAIGDGGDGACGSSPTRDKTLAQDLDDLHGKLLRIVPDPVGGGYAPAPSNPMITQSGNRRAIWARGLRNPWRFSFDGNQLWIADVGDDLQEELDRVDATTLPSPTTAHNFGWPCVEGTRVWSTTGICSALAAEAPVSTFAHAGCAAIIGGAVLRDASLPQAATGRYLFSSFCGGPFGSGQLLSADSAGAAPLAVRDEHLSFAYGVSDLSTDGCGHAYVLNVTVGGVSRIEGNTPGACGEFVAPDTAVTTPALGASSTFTYASTQRGTTFTCRLDGVALPCATTDVHQTTGSLVVGPVGAGAHTFTVQAANEAQLADATPAAQSWTIDAPKLPDPTEPPPVITLRMLAPAGCCARTARRV